MNLTEEQLESVRQAGEWLIPPTLVAINLEVDEMDFLVDIRTPGTPIHRAYYAGYLNQLTETRVAIIKAARNGSNPAQMEVLKFIQEVNQQLKYE